MAEYAISGDVATLAGDDHTAGDPAALWVESSAPILVDSTTGRVGGRLRVTLEDDGTFSQTGLPETVSGVSPLYRLVVDTLSLRRAGHKRGLTTGWFPLAANRDLTWVIANYVEVTTVTAQVAADVAAAAALGATNDTATASFVNDSGSATAAALTDTIDTRIEDVAYVLKPSAFDGATPNRTVIQDAIDAVWNAGAGRGTVRLPDGAVIDITPPVGSYAITARPGVTLTGNATLRVHDDAPEYFSLFSHAAADDVSGFALDGLTIDQNKANNPAPAQVDWNGDGSDAAVVVRLYRGTGVGIRNCTFKNIDGVNTLIVNGNAAGSAPSVIQGVHIVNNNFLDVGGVNAHDHSTIYTHAEGVLISGNHFYGTDAATPSLSAYCAIETHGSGTRIIGNHVERYREAVNATGVANRTESLTVIGNTARKVLRGFRVLSSKVSGATSDLMLRGAVIANNSVVCDVDWWTQSFDLDPYGIALLQDGTAYFDGVSILGNHVEIMTYSGTSTNVAKLGASGILVSHSGTATNTSRNLLIANNSLIGAPSCPILVTAAKIRSVRIQNNVATDWGHASLATSDYKSGIFVGGTGCDYPNLVISGNTLADATAKGIRGISWFATATSTGGRIEDNLVSLAALTGAGARDLTIAASSGAPYLRHRYRTGSANPSGACEYDSQITFLTGGTKVSQTASPSGTTWA